MKNLSIAIGLLLVLGGCQSTAHRIYVECENATYYANVWHQEYGYIKNSIGCYNYSLSEPTTKMEQFYPCDFIVKHWKSYSCVNRDWGDAVILEIKSRDPVISQQ